MALMRWTIGGLIGGLLGAAIWAAIGYGTNHEVGWIAWGIGFMVGMGVRMAAPEEDGPVAGGLAVLISIGSILLGKFAVIYLLVNHHMGELPNYRVDNPETMIAVTADAVEEEFKTANKVVPPAPQPDNPDAPIEQQYSPVVWKEAQQRWQSLPEDQKQAKTVEHERATNEMMQAFVGSMQSSVRGEAFSESFSPYDALWFILASLTAFRIGSGASSNEE